MSSTDPPSRQPVGDLAYLDDLTGLRNRRFLTELFDDDWSRWREEFGNLTILMLDLDGFKAVNDRHGHLTGDRVLVEVAQILEGSFRGDDLIVRYGGDEFVVVLPGAGTEEARRLASRAREVVDDHLFLSHPKNQTIQGEISFSVGAASAPEDGGSGEEVLAIADGRLFEEKKSRKAGRRAPERPSHRRWRLLAAVLTVLLLLGLGSAWIWFREAPSRTLRPAMPSAAVLEARSAERQRLQVEMDQLLDRIGRLVEDLDVERSRPRREELAEELEAVQVRLQELEGEVEEEASPAISQVSSVDLPALDEGEGHGSIVSQPELAPASPAEEAEVPTGVGEPGQESPAVVLSILAPRLVTSPAPRYPSIARRLQREATIEVRVVVGSDGRVVEAEVISGPRAYGFREAALDSARRARFEPARVDGEAVEQETRLSIRFQLEAPGDAAP